MDELTPIYRVEQFLDTIVNGSANPYDPIYRIEKYLAKIAGKDVEVPTPIYRVEMYLAYLCGMNVTIPDPIYRIEMYLAKKCGMEVETPVPVYRIEYWLNEWANGSSGSLVTITGVSPLTLANAIAHSIHSLTQYGKIEQRNLPSGYTELEYIQGDGSQYIDLNTTLDQDDVIEIEFELTASQNSRNIFGYRNGASSNNIMLFLGGTNNRVFIDFNNSEYAPYRLSCDCTVGTKYKAVISKSRRAFLAADGTVLAENTTLCEDTIACPSAYLFHASGSPAYNSMGLVKIYSCKITGKRDLVGAKDASNVVEMYDKVTAAPFANAGTGSFTAGSATVPTPNNSMDLWCNNGVLKARRQSGLPLAYQMVEWLKSAGAITITGFKTKSTQEIETVFYRERSGSSYLYASDTATSGTTNTTAYLTSGGGNWRWDGKTATINVSTGVKVTSIQNKDGVWINGTKSGSYSSPVDFVSTNDLRLSSGENTTVRIESQTIREGETVTLDLVPVQRLSDSAYGFYDKVSGNFYTNAEATFEAGDPIADPVEIYTDGTPEVLTVNGPNLLSRDGETTGYIITADGTVSENANYCISAPFTLGAGDYVCTWNPGTGGNRPFSVYACEADGTPKTDGRIFYKASAVTGINTGEFTVSQATLVVSSYRVNATDLTISAEQTVTDIPMLLAVGDVKDEAKLVVGLLTHKVGIYVITGDESGWGTSSTAGIYTLAVGFVK